MARPNTREQIVQAGLKCLIEKGFNGVGVQEITNAAGVPKGSFYNHFESKEALGAEIVEQYSNASARRAILRDTSIPPLERLRRNFEPTCGHLKGSDFSRGCLLGNFSAELSGQSEMIRKSLAGAYVRWTEDIASAIAEAQTQGAIATKTPAGELAAFVLDSFEGALLRARVEKNTGPIERFLEFAFKKILI